MTNIQKSISIKSNNNELACDQLNIQTHLDQLKWTKSNQGKQ